MGGRSSSSTSRSTTSNVVDKRIGASDGSVVATEGGQIIVENITPEIAETALAQSLGLVKQEGAGYRDLIAGALSMVETSQERATAQSESAMAQAFEMQSATTDKAFQSIKSEASQGFDGLLRAGTAVAVVGLLVWGARGALK